MHAANRGYTPDLKIGSLSFAFKKLFFAILRDDSFSKHWPRKAVTSRQSTLNFSDFCDRIRLISIDPKLAHKKPNDFGGIQF